MTEVTHEYEGVVYVGVPDDIDSCSEIMDNFCVSCSFDGGLVGCISTNGKCHEGPQLLHFVRQDEYEKQ